MPDRVLITGANGYLGARCVERLAASPEHEVIALWHTGQDRLMPNPPAHVHYERCDLADPHAVGALFARWQVTRVLHAAALLPDQTANYLSRAVQSNIAATAYLVEAAAGTACRRFVYCSSISVYGDAPCPASGWRETDHPVPNSVYGWTKHAGEACVQLQSRAAGLSAATLRLAGIHGVGRRSGVVFHVTRAASAAEPIVVDDAGGPFQLLFLDDAVDVAISALHAALNEPYECINVASHVFGSLGSLAERIVHVCASPSSVRSAAAEAGGNQVMDVARMRRILAFDPPDPDVHLGNIRNALAGIPHRYAAS